MFISNIIDIVEMISNQKKNEKIYPYFSIILTKISKANIIIAEMVIISKTISAFTLVAMILILSPNKE